MSSCIVFGEAGGSRGGKRREEGSFSLSSKGQLTGKMLTKAVLDSVG